MFGNEGDDWIEFGIADGAAGDNFDPFGLDPIIGNDVFFGDSTPTAWTAKAATTSWSATAAARGPLLGTPASTGRASSTIRSA